MFRNIVFSAFGAALLVCLAVTGLQSVSTQPLILHAEEYEASAATLHTEPADSPGAALVRVHVVSTVQGGDVHEHDDEGWAPADGLERMLYTALANLVVAFAVALMLLGGMVLKGGPIDARRGLLWGIAGFAALSLLPAFGLPPELPGTPAADIVERQVWWLGTAAASAVGIWLIAFGRHWALKAAGLALLVAPHAVGAPQPPSHDVAYPGGLAGQFVVASMLVSAVLWSLSGLASGWLYQRLSRNA